MQACVVLTILSFKIHLKSGHPSWQHPTYKDMGFELCLLALNLIGKFIYTVAGALFCRLSLDEHITWPN